MYYDERVERREKDQLEQDIESCMDTHGLTATLALITSICYAKAEQDAGLAKAWERNAELIDNLKVRDL
jgi:hypothetical protein